MMKKVIFFVSKKILLGQVSCKYCFQKNFVGYVALKKHFIYECKGKQCTVEHCDCFFCDPEVDIMKYDGVNLYLNKFSIETYFADTPFNFWGIVKPHFVLQDANDCFIFEESAPVVAA